MEMTLSALVAQLTDLFEQHGDIRVRLAVQPNWPLVHGIANIAVGEEGSAAKREGKTLWIAASSGHPYDENPYAPKAAWDEEEFSDDEDEEDDGSARYAERINR